jgi:hypothetical protein
LIALRALAQAPPSLGDAASFAVLGGSGVTSSGETVVSGNLGVSPGETIAGFPPGRVELGAIFRRDATARAAQRDSAAAFDDLAARACSFPLTALEATLAPGVYCLPSATLAGTLILDAADDPDAVWIFQIADALTTADDSRVVVTGGGSGGRVFWQVGSSVTLGAHSAFIGTILARTDITLRRHARLSGRALARTGAVTLDANAVSMCCPLITLSPSILPPPIAGLPYAQAITATGGAAPYTFTIPFGELPAGLVLDPRTGLLSGITTAAGRFDFIITATDANGCTGSELYTLPMTAGVPALSAWSLAMLAALIGGVGFVMMRRSG